MFVASAHVACFDENREFDDVTEHDADTVDFDHQTALVAEMAKISFAMWASEVSLAKYKQCRRNYVIDT